MRTLDFGTFRGNAPAKELLCRLLAADRLPQAILIQGDRGSGKRMLARRLAQACVCTGDAARPCGVCAACRKSMTGGHPDIAWIDGGDRPRAFPVEAVRSLRETLYVRPNEAARKVYVLTQAHNMTDAAQNALLKSLEEPPGYAVFILTCESARQLLPTVRSRAVTVSLTGVSEADAVAAVTAMVPAADESAVRASYALLDGVIGQMAESLSDGLLPKAQALCDALPDALLDPAETALLRLTAPMTDRAMCRAVCIVLRARLADAAAGQGGWGRALTPAQAARCVQCTTDALRAAERYANAGLTVTRLCAELRRAVGR